jgi:hypothetical protein
MGEGGGWRPGAGVLLAAALGVVLAWAGAAGTAGLTVFDATGASVGPVVGFDRHDPIVALPGGGHVGVARVRADRFLSTVPAFIGFESPDCTGLPLLVDEGPGGFQALFARTAVGPGKLLLRAAAASPSPAVLQSAWRPELADPCVALSGVDPAPTFPTTELVDLNAFLPPFVAR